VTAPTARRRGRPPKSDDPGTKDRLLEAAADECVAVGFESVTLAGIAERAGVTATAVYNHFTSKEQLLYAAGRRALDALAASLSPAQAGPAAVHEIALAYLRPDHAGTRRLFLELHLAGARHPDLAAHLADWHREFARAVGDSVASDDSDPAATVKALFLLLLGVCHLEDLGAVEADGTAVVERVGRLVDALYPVPGS
jgi:AcrR family transcriptional regulator